MVLTTSPRSIGSSLFFCMNARHRTCLMASSAILAHTHPSDAAEPSRADEFPTQTLKTALALVDGKRGLKALLPEAVRMSRIA